MPFICVEKLQGFGPGLSPVIPVKHDSYEEAEQYRSYNLKDQGGHRYDILEVRLIK